MGISLADKPRLLLTVAVRLMPAERREWGEAMLAELAQLQNTSIRWRFALGCSRVAMFPPRRGGLLQTIMNHKMESIVTALGSAALISLILVLPFERLIISAWAKNMRRELGTGPPDNIEDLGTDENPLLNRALDISVGLAQIKPRTAQTASVLATGRTPGDLPKPAFFSYRDVEPVGDEWTPLVKAQTTLIAPIPVPAERHVVAGALLDTQSNLEMCAVILALYQNQWEATNRDWSIRERPDILATLYQIGFARSKPHGAPQSNAFGSRVRQVYEQPWLGELFDATPRPQK